MKSKLLLLILGVTIALLGQAQNTTIAYEGFDYTIGTGITGVSGGTGWAQSWQAQNNDAAVYNIQSTTPLTYTSLTTTAKYLSGPQSWESCWRVLDVTQFSSYLDNNNLIGASGTTLYYSMLLRKDAANSDPTFVLFSPNTNWADLTNLTQYGNAVALGFFGNRGNMWSLRVGSTIVDVAPLTVGVPVLLVAKFTFGSTNQVDVYVNPVIANGEPATAQGTASSTNSISFNRLGYLGGDNTAVDASLDEIRFSNSFTAAVPTSTSGNVTPLAWGINGSAGTNPLINFMGTTDNNDLNIRTNNVNRINVAKTGEVTISSLNGTGSSLPAVDATGKLSRVGNGTAGQYLQYTAGGPAWSNVSSEWNKTGFFDPPTNSWPGLLSNTWTQKVVVNADVTEFNSYVSAWQGISVGSYNKYTPHNDGRPLGVNDIVNGAPWYGIALLNGSVNGINYSPVQVAGYNGIVMVDNTASSGPALKIQNGNVGIATGYNTALNQKFTVNGNIKILTTGNGIIFPDGTLQTTAGMNGTGGGDGYWHTVNGNVSISYTCSIFTIYTYYPPGSNLPQTGEVFDGTFPSTYDQTTVTGNGKIICTPSISGSQLQNAIETDLKVGIGTNTPVTALQVVGDVVISRTQHNTFAQGYGSKLYFGYDNGQGPASEETSNPQWISRYNNDVSNSELRVSIGNNGFGNALFQIGSANTLSTAVNPWLTAFAIDIKGNTTIGGAIRINGKVLSQDIRVTMNPLIDPFPDYVFDNDYKLMSIESLEKFIKINKHLPEIPSEKEVYCSGSIDLKQMNIMLLKKVEEITIHLIKEHNRNNKLEKEVSTLKALIKK